MKNFTTFLGGWDPFSINNFAFSINNEPVSQGEIALKFLNSQIQNLLITDNVSSSGGGIYVRNESIVQINNATIANNVAASYGGGIYLRDGADVSFNNSIVVFSIKLTNFLISFFLFWRLIIKYTILCPGPW